MRSLVAQLPVFGYLGAMRRGWQLVRHGFELGGAVSLLALVGAGGALAAIVGFVAEMPLGLRLLLALSVLLLVTAAGLALVGWLRTRPSAAVGARSRPSIVDGDVTAGGSAYIADVTVGASAGPSHAERVRWIRNEIKQLMCRLDQLDVQARDYTSAWPIRQNPYAPLPVTQWELHGGAMRLPVIDYDTIDHAYALAAAFNEGRRMSLAQETFGGRPPEPDLAALRSAFERADAALAAHRTGQP
ncbi:MAG: hypothetical protein LC777_20230 [Actinobacteria bacterium]|nr:hypothetical protein [Actinomycetota bacterium]